VSNAPLAPSLNSHVCAAPGLPTPLVPTVQFVWPYWDRSTAIGSPPCVQTPTPTSPAGTQTGVSSVTRLSAGSVTSPWVSVPLSW
jgi:hypothetical protein